jgi:hypothetical protein
MTGHDSAFLWETEAIRAAARRRPEIAGADRPGAWVTLRVASDATEIPVETLRKWARRGTIPTYLEERPGSPSVRMVDLAGVRRRAAHLGRSLPRVTPDAPPAPEPATTVPEPDATAASGTMIVPVDAWNKMLNQLGNLHEAGQQLAEARERAAKAETEARFLRERLAELRNRQAPHPDSDQPAPVVPGPPPEKVWHYLVRRWRAPRGGPRGRA